MIGPVLKPSKAHCVLIEPDNSEDNIKWSISLYHELAILK